MCRTLERLFGKRDSTFPFSKVNSIPKSVSGFELERCLQRRELERVEHGCEASAMRKHESHHCSLCSL